MKLMMQKAKHVCATLSHIKYILHKMISDSFELFQRRICIVNVTDKNYHRRYIRFE